MNRTFYSSSGVVSALQGLSLSRNLLLCGLLEFLLSCYFPHLMFLSLTPVLPGSFHVSLDLSVFFVNGSGEELSYPQLLIRCDWSGKQAFRLLKNDGMNI